MCTICYLCWCLLDLSTWRFKTVANIMLVSYSWSTSSFIQWNLYYTVKPLYMDTPIYGDWPQPDCFLSYLLIYILKKGVVIGVCIVLSIHIWVVGQFLVTDTPYRRGTVLLVQTSSSKGLLANNDVISVVGYHQV